MHKKRLYKLKIDEEFQKLIPELTKEETDILEELLLKEGCRKPVSVWNDYIIDGYNINNLSDQTEKDLGNINKKLSKHKTEKSSSAKNKLLTKFKQTATIPDYDPDSDVMSLALTIPYWIDFVDRIINKKDISDVSGNAKWKLITELGNLDAKLKEITLIMENSDG